MSDTADKRELDPDRLDRLLADLEQELDQLSPDNPASQEIRQEIETLRALLESRTAGYAWSSQESHVIQKSLQRITDRLKGDSSKDSPFFGRIAQILGFA